jgi:hypothetical protein
MTEKQRETEIQKLFANSSKPVPISQDGGTPRYRKSDSSNHKISPQLLQALNSLNMGSVRQ